MNSASVMPRGYHDKKLANLIIAGVNKAGSTSLFHYLSSHPDVCGSRYKETCYFLPLNYNQPLRSIREYERQFVHCKESRYRLEATPGYMTGGLKMAEKISETLGDVRILIILKDPVDRLVTFYKRKKATLQLPRELTFKNYVHLCRQIHPGDLTIREKHLYTALTTGKYCDFIEPWLSTFGDRIKVVFFDDMRYDAHHFMSEISTWLNIDPLFYENFDFDVKNKSMNYHNRFLQRIAVSANNAGQRIWRRHPKLKKKLLSCYYQINGASFSNDEIDPASIKFLRNYYAPYNSQLYKIFEMYGLHDSVPSWLIPEKVPA